MSETNPTGDEESQLAAVHAAADEPHHPEGTGSRLNWLRAGVLGANDGIVSTAGVIIGVAGATTDRGPVATAAIAALVAGALSMAAGEYVSVSTQRDTERALIAKEAASCGRSRRRSWPSWPCSIASAGLTPSWPTRWPSS